MGYQEHAKLDIFIIWNIIPDKDRYDSLHIFNQAVSEKPIKSMQIFERHVKKMLAFLYHAVQFILRYIKRPCWVEP